jgi:hypothetical protein
MTTQTDRELLEAAARAAGVDVDWRQSVQCLCYSGSPYNVAWNPLADDGDAFRLMAKLGLDVQYSPEAVEVVAHQHARIDGREVIAPWAWESLLDSADPNAATRRAIVRAAAALDTEAKQ